jgi:hypothetical protein
MASALITAAVALNSLLAERDMSGALGGLIIQIGFVSAIAYIPLQLYTALRYRGGWRIAAFVPIAPMVAVFAYTAYAFARQSNLWPILLIFAAPVGTGCLIALMAVRRFATPRASP